MKRQDAYLEGDGAVAQGDEAIAAGAGSIIIRGDGNIVVRGENVRDKELSYLDSLLKQYAYWQDHYTPLAGIAEVRASVQDGPRLNMPLPFIPREFEVLARHGYGEQAEVRRESVVDLRSAVKTYRRVLLLGGPGSGKSTTLWRLAHDYATRAWDNPRDPLPVLVPLGGYMQDEPFEAYLAQSLGPLAPYLRLYRAANRLVLLLDGLNEMPRDDFPGRVSRICKALRAYPNESVAITCRTRDYPTVIDMGMDLAHLHRVEVSPLDVGRIRDFLCNYLGAPAGATLFWRMAGQDVRELWNIWQDTGGDWDTFWSSGVISEILSGRNEPRKFEDLCPLLAMGRNPYLLLMTAQVYASAGGQLPTHRTRMFEAFVETLLERERGRRHNNDEISVDLQIRVLAVLAYAMQAAGGVGTTVTRQWASARIRESIPASDPETVLDILAGATLLGCEAGQVKFYHHLLQEYFAARAVLDRLASGDPLIQDWASDRWWQPSGWEETIVMAVEMAPDAAEVIREVVQVNPLIAGHCLLEGHLGIDKSTQNQVLSSLVSLVNSDACPAQGRARVGRTLAKLHDPRPGVGLTSEGVPDLAWCRVPAGEFLLGSSDDDRMAGDQERPQRAFRTRTAYQISRYPITQVQYAAFVRAGGYTIRRYWTEAGWEAKDRGGWRGPENFGDPYTLSNHPVIGVSWYEALAFCGWLTEILRRAEALGALQVITLPTEPQWEKAARGTDGRLYPWGDKLDPDNANYSETGIGTTHAVGCFPRGRSPYGADEMSGHVFEWCRTIWQGSYRNYQPDDTVFGDERRVARGGSFYSHGTSLRCAYRDGYDPEGRYWNHGFRVVVDPAD